MSGRDDYFRFLDLPAELRNRIYDFATETQADPPRCVLPCLALAQVCQQLRTEYRPICMKREIIIDWETVPGYMRTFFPTVNGNIENVELTPTSVTIVSPWRGEEEENGYKIDLLPMIKIGLCRPDFACYFMYDEEALEDGAPYLQEGIVPLKTLLSHRSAEWVSDIETGKITRIMISDIGGHAAPRAVFYITTFNLEQEIQEEEPRRTIEEIYFARVGLFEIWPWDSEFPAFPTLAWKE